jgi:hypothetical protein
VIRGLGIVSVLKGRDPDLELGESRDNLELGFKDEGVRK